MKQHNTCFDIIEGEMSIHESMKEGNNVFVFYTNNINVSQRASIPASKVKEAVNDVSYLVYECKTPDTMNSIDKNTKYFNIKKLTGFGDVVLLDDMKVLASQFMTRIFVFRKTAKELASTASHSVVFSRNPNYISDRHCQSGQNAVVYELMKDVIYTCGDTETVGGKKRKHTRRRRSIRKRSTRRRRR